MCCYYMPVILGKGFKSSAVLIPFSHRVQLSRVTGEKLGSSELYILPFGVHSLPHYLFVFINLFILFIFFWLHWVFVAACRLSLVSASRGYCSLRCVGFSSRWLLLLPSLGSRCAGFSSCGSWTVEHRLSRCGARAQLLRRMWDLPGPGLEPGSPALAGRFLTTVPPGKPLITTLL